MKKNPNQNKLGMLDWMLSIDFDPVEVVRLKHAVPTAYVSILDDKRLETRNGD